MKQPTPNVTLKDVERVVSRDFPAENCAEILELIDAVEVRENARVILACLKNSGGDLVRLKNELRNAEGYWRETISEAEYPGYSKKVFRSADLTAEDRQGIYKKDWEQYSEWLGSE